MRTFWKCFALVFLFSGCSQFSGRLKNDEQLQALIEAEVEAALSGNIGLVTLTELGDFQWSQLLVLAPYSPIGELGEELGVDLSPLSRFDIGQRDDITLFVFLNEGKPARVVAYPRSAGDFAEVKPVLIPRKAAVFHMQAMPSGRVKMRLVGM